MKFGFTVVGSIPCLAWCCSITAGADTLVVRHGTAVHLGSGFFAEGAWNGPMSGESLRRSTVCAASGAVIDGASVVFVTPSNTLGRLHAARVGARLLVSNSLAFLLVEAQLCVDESYLHYEDDLSSIMDGLPRKRRSIPTADGNRIQLFWHCNAVARQDLGLDIEQKAVPEPFERFSDYSSFLSGALSAISANAADPSRTTAYRAMVSISKGYDSATCAVLASGIGCADALTVYDPDAADPYDDCGTEIASHLNMQIVSVSRSEYRALQSEPEFLCVGTGGEDVFIAPLQEALRARMFITGFHGDKVWDRNAGKSTTRIVRGDPSGADLEEFRLRVNFVHVALPFFGCVRQPQILSISRSAEMKQWTLGTEYDRPICRRIVEGAGVPREAFGQRKRVMSRAFRSEKHIGWYLGPASLEQFEAYIDARKAKRTYFAFQALHGLMSSAALFSELLSRVSFKLSQLPIKATSHLRRYREPLDDRRFLFHWAISKQVERYRDTPRSPVDAVT